MTERKCEDCEAPESKVDLYVGEGEMILCTVCMVRFIEGTAKNE